MTDSQLRDIGRITIAWSDVEGFVQSILPLLISPRDPEVGRLLVTGDAIDLQLERLERLLEIRFGLGDSEATQITEWLGRVRQLKGQRNRVVHSVWVPPTKEGTPLKLLRTRRRIERPATYSVTEAELGRLAREAEALEAEGLEMFRLVIERLLPRVRGED